MESLGKINISYSTFEKLKNKKIGEGQDAVVYDAGRGILFKVYKDNTNLRDINSKTKIYNRKTVVLDNNFERNCYVDKEGVKIYYRDAMKRIIKRQENINYSSLPIGALYINGKFSGCVLKKIYGLQLHYAFPFLSKRRKIKVLQELLKQIKELTDNHIYPLDVCNSPFAGYHSNILLDYTLKPKLIDLDGHSTVYRETADENMLNETFESLNILFFELLFGFELQYGEAEDVIEYSQIMRNINISDELITKLMDLDGNYEDLNKLILAYKNHK